MRREKGGEKIGDWKEMERIRITVSKEREKKKKKREDDKKKDVDRGRGAHGAQWKRAGWCGPVSLGWRRGRGLVGIGVYNSFSRIRLNLIMTTYNQLKYG